jgi:exodeoxyribonuclease VIII
MLDLEALDPKIGGVLVSIGAVYFDFETGELGDTFYREISRQGLEEQYKEYNRTISLRCLQWWMQQSDGAREVFQAKDCHGNDFKTALRAFRQFVDGPKTRIWGNGADFDNVFLADCYKSVGLRLPWSFRYNRCYRTVKNMFGHKAKLVRVGNHHNALDDAKTQAVHLMAMMKGEKVNE